jgi:hypothetical protein
MGPIPDHPERLNVIASSRRARLVFLATRIPTGHFNNKKITLSWNSESDYARLWRFFQ